MSSATKHSVPSLTPMLSNEEQAKQNRVFRRRGFVINYARAAWIVKHCPDSAASNLVKAVNDPAQKVQA